MRAERRRALRCELIVGDLGAQEANRTGVAGCDAVVHGAAEYRNGIAPAACARMAEVNVGGAERVTDAAIGAGAGRIVHVSTANVFGEHPRRRRRRDVRAPAGRVRLRYDETKWRARRAAKSGSPAARPS